MVVDFHNHVLPGVDDGARDAGETRAALRAMHTAGVRLVIATPHIQASAIAGGSAEAAAYRNRIATALDDARRILELESTDLKVELGAEILLDDANATLDDPTLRLAGTRFVLVEFSLFGVPPNAADMLFRFRAQGWHPVLGHPERYTGLSVAVLEQWHQNGTLLQANAGSFLGDYGPEARGKAWELVRRGMIHYICSDYHARGKYRVPDALDALQRRGGKRQRQILLANAVRLSRDEMPVAVPPLRRVPWYRSIFKRK